MGECRDYAEKYTLLFVLGLSLEQDLKIYCHESRLARSGAGSNPGKSHSMKTLLDIGPESMLRPMGELARPATRLSRKLPDSALPPLPAR